MDYYYDNAKKQDLFRASEVIINQPMAKEKVSNGVYKYISFECCLIHHIKKEIGPILNYGVVKYAMNITCSDYQVISEAIELYFNKKLPAILNNVFKTAGVGLNNKPFDKLDKYEIKNIYNQMLDELSNGVVMDQSQFITTCYPYIQISLALKSLNLTAADFSPLISNYKRINNVVQDHERQFGKDAMVSLKTSTIIEFRNSDKDNREFELLKGYLAIKSIQGQKDFAGTNKAFITSRMIGAKTVSIAEQLIKDKATKKLYNRFNERYFFDQLIIELQAKSFITAKITYNRKMYLSTQIDGTLLAAAIANSIENKQLSQVAKVIKQNEKLFKNSITNTLNNR